LESAVAEIREGGGDAIAVAVDLTRETEVARLVEQALATFGRIDCLVNNAGESGPTKPVQEYSVEDWMYTVNSCLTSSYLCARFVVPALVATGRGAIVNIASIAGRRGMPYRVGYCSAKAGQIGLTYGLALELGRYNVTVNAIAPGAVEGERIERAMEGQAQVTGTPVQIIRKGLVERSPLRRMSTADDIAWAAAFLCSDHARSLSGQVITVNAGEPAS
jgi:NAD(P)-dependent dehydrogenase (short-subunit alcohol dehydrogenase family)